MLLRVIDFKGNNWQRDFRVVKKKLRGKKVPFTIKKTPDDGTILYSIWADEEYIDEARDLVALYYSKKPEIVSMNQRVESLAEAFEDEWIYALIALFIYYPKKHPLYFTAILIVILAMVFFPLV